MESGTYTVDIAFRTTDPNRQRVDYRMSRLAALLPDSARIEPVRLDQETSTVEIVIAGLQAFGPAMALDTVTRAIELAAIDLPRGYLRRVTITHVEDAGS